MQCDCVVYSKNDILMKPSSAYSQTQLVINIIHVCVLPVYFYCNRFKTESEIQSQQEPVYETIDDPNYE